MGPMLALWTLLSGLLLHGIRDLVQYWCSWWPVALAAPCITSLSLAVMLTLCMLNCLFTLSKLNSRFPSLPDAGNKSSKQITAIMMPSYQNRTMQPIPGNSRRRAYLVWISQLPLWKATSTGSRTQLIYTTKSNCRLPSYLTQPIKLGGVFKQWSHIDSLEPGCSNSSALQVELLQACFTLDICDFKSGGWTKERWLVPNTFLT